MRLQVPVVTAAVALLVSMSCTQSDRESATQRARRVEAEAKRDAHRIEQKAKRAASEISDTTKSALERAHIQSDTAEESAKRKLHAGTQELRRDLNRAGSAVTEAAITARVKSKLASQIGLHGATEIGVHTSGSVVTLEGAVNSADEKQAAEKATASVEGVTRVIDHVRVRPL